MSIKPDSSQSTASERVFASAAPPEVYNVLGPREIRVHVFGKPEHSGELQLFPDDVIVVMRGLAAHKAT